MSRDAQSQAYIYVGESLAVATAQMMLRREYLANDQTNLLDDRNGKSPSTQRIPHHIPQLRLLHLPRPLRQLGPEDDSIPLLRSNRSTADQRDTVGRNSKLPNNHSTRAAPPASSNQLPPLSSLLRA